MTLSKTRSSLVALIASVALTAAGIGAAAHSETKPAPKPAMSSLDIDSTRSDR